MTCFRCKGIRHCPQRKHYLRQKRKKHFSESVCLKLILQCPCRECIVKPVCETLEQARYHGFCTSYKKVGIDVINCPARDDFTIKFNKLFKTTY
jgi:hypothetical protein